MINRTMVRTEVMKTLFAYYQTDGKTPGAARKELLSNFASIYNLYMMLLEMVNSITRYAEQELEEEKQRAKFTHKNYVENRRFIENRLAQQLFENRQLRHYVQTEHLDWDYGMDAIISIYRQIKEMPQYKEYMQQPQVTYEDDKRLWRKIFQNVIINNQNMISAMEDLEVKLDQNCWMTDIDLVATYVDKTLKSFTSKSDNTHPLLEMFDKEEELTFGTELLEYALAHKAEYDAMIEKNLRNWDADRIAYMDKIILQVALAEILNFPDIALEISMNEYLELAKEYSSDKSHSFINGILDVILKELRNNNTLIKNIK